MSLQGRLQNDEVVFQPSNLRIQCSRKYLNEPSREICDAIIVRGTTAILVETKLATCAAIIRYSGCYKTMRTFLEDRLVSGTTRDVGVGQLLNVIENLTAMPATNLPPWLRGIRKFIPLIVTKDEIGSGWGG
jgi:hypothetical protein